jgi:hypothetical protein
MTIKPWTFFMMAIAGWMSRQQQDAIAYLKPMQLKGRKR